jgi:hypothetical protein
MKSVDLERAAFTHHKETQGREYAFSVASFPGLTADELVQRAAFLHSVIRETTVGALRSNGYDVILTDEPSAHDDLVLPSDPSEEHWVRLRGIFGEPRPNPVHVRR